LVEELALRASVMRRGSVSFMASCKPMPPAIDEQRLWISDSQCDKKYKQLCLWISNDKE
jgi:hypothetical protein